MKEITEAEWNKYQWISIGRARFVRGVKYTTPPNDGYHYVEVTTISDSEQKWARAAEG